MSFQILKGHFYSKYKEIIANYSKLQIDLKTRR